MGCNKSKNKPDKTPVEEEDDEGPLSVVHPHGPYEDPVVAHSQTTPPINIVAVEVWRVSEGGDYVREELQTRPQQQHEGERLLSPSRALEPPSRQLSPEAMMLLSQNLREQSLGLHRSDERDLVTRTLPRNSHGSPEPYEWPQSRGEPGIEWKNERRTHVRPDGRDHAAYLFAQGLGSSTTQVTKNRRGDSSYRHRRESISRRVEPQKVQSQSDSDEQVQEAPEKIQRNAISHRHPTELSHRTTPERGHENIPSKTTPLAVTKPQDTFEEFSPWKSSEAHKKYLKHLRQRSDISTPSPSSSSTNIKTLLRHVPKKITFPNLKSIEVLKCTPPNKGIVIHMEETFWPKKRQIITNYTVMEKIDAHVLKARNKINTPNTG